MEEAAFIVVQQRFIGLLSIKIVIVIAANRIAVLSQEFRCNKMVSRDQEHRNRVDTHGYPLIDC